MPKLSLTGPKITEGGKRKDQGSERLGLMFPVPLRCADLLSRFKSSLGIGSQAFQYLIHPLSPKGYIAEDLAMRNVECRSCYSYICFNYNNLLDPLFFFSMSSDKSTRPAKPVEIPRSAPSSSGLSFRAFFPLFGLLVVLIYQNYPGISSTIITRLSGNASLADRPAPGQLAIVEQDVPLPDSARCPIQPEPLNVGEDWNPLEDSVYSNLAAKRLSKAVQIDTVAYDDMPMDTTDPAFDKHFVFARFIEHEYPKLISDLKHEVINNHGHLFTWEGSNPNLKPIMLMAHIDTVPVPPETLGQWKYLPFEGAITQDGTPDTPGTWIWGRGSSDCKNSLLGIYGAVERLISEGYKPERTVIISNGFDEEVSIHSIRKPQ